MKIARCALVALVVLVALSGCDRVVRVSGSASGGDADGESGTYPGSRVKGGIALDGTGRVVVFESTSTNLLPGGNTAGLFLRDLSTGSIERLASGWAPDITPDGRYVVYADYAIGTGEVRVLDRVTNTTQVVSVRPDGEPSGSTNRYPAISDDGRHVAWESQSDQLVPGVIGINVFVRDLQTGTTDLVSRAADGGLADETSHTPAISADGRFVAFSSWASNLTVGDTPTGYREVFRRDLLTGVTEKVSIDDGGAPISFSALNPTISDDGGLVAFDGPGTVYVRDLGAGRTEDLGRGQLPAISGDGRMVVFVTSFPLSPWDTNGRLDVYAHDRVADTTTQLSVTGDWKQTDGDSTGFAAQVSPAISDDGHLSAFATERPLDATDHNARRDVYLRAARRPSVSSVSPSALSPGTEATLVVIGDGFTPTSDAGVDLPGWPGVHATDVEFVSAQELRVQVTVDADAAPGSRALLVTNRTAEPGNPTSIIGFCRGCLTVG